MKSLLLCACAAGLTFAQVPTAGDYQISGVMVDHLTNRPLNHVLVQITQTSKNGGTASAVTEADGRFTFVHVPKGKYQLTAEKRGQRPHGFHEDGGYATAIVVDGRQKTDGIVFPMATDASINGVVTGDDGEPIRSANVGLLRENVNDGVGEVAEVKSISTNSSGQFHFGHLDGGKYYVSLQGRPWFAAQNGAQSEVVYPVTFYGDTTDGRAATPIVLPEGGTTSVQINLHSVPAIHVKLADKNQLPGLFVPGPGDSRIPVATTTYTGAENRGFVRGIRMPAQRLGMRSAPPVVSAVDAPAGDMDAPLDLTSIAAGRYEVMINGGLTQTVELANGSILNIHGATASQVSGTMVFEGQRPSGNLEIFLGGGKHGSMAEIKQDGTFRFEKVSAGRLNVHLSNPTLTIMSVSAKGARVVGDGVEVPPGGSVELNVRAGETEALSSADGFVVRDGAGVAGAMVLLMPQDLGRSRLLKRDQSDGDGSFNLRGIPPGRYTLVAIDDGKDLLYRTESVIKPYLAGGLPVTFPLKSGDPLLVPVQARQR